MVGSWKILDIEACNLPQQVTTGFAQVTQDLQGATYTPALYCAVQIVSGTNHMIICKQTLITNPIKEAMVKMVLHQSLPTEESLIGNFTIVSIEEIV